jgi:protein SCO1/2
MSMRMRVIAVLVLLLSAGAPTAARPAELRGAVLSPPRRASDFALATPEGRSFRLSDQRGRVVALSFGYTSCPDVCPTTLAELVQVRSRLGAAGARFQVVFITVDPERDTPERLREYAQGFAGGLVALTGDPEALARVRRAYGVVAEKRAVPGTRQAYLIDHSAFVYVIDPDGRLRVLFNFGASIEDMTHTVRLLLGG